MYEELLMAEEGLQQTEHEKIYIAPPSDDIDMKKIEEKLVKLNHALKNYSNEQRQEIKEVMKEVVPTYKEKSTN